MKNKLIFACLFAVITLLTGCASVPMASPEADQKAKQFTTIPDKSKIYVYRNETFGSAIKMPVSIDGAMVGQTAPRTYIMWEGKPGKHEIISYGENSSNLILNTKANQNYYVWQEIKMGAFAARSKLHLESEATGKDGVNQCGLIQ